jgi:hypothetical protein
MNYKCQCPKPDYMRLEREHSTLILPLEDCIHFRKADRECARCGAPLCERCAEKEIHTVISGEDGGFEGVFTYLCRTCAELEDK